MTYKEKKGRVFLDTNVLVSIIGNTESGKNLIQILNQANLEIVTFRKCIYELYSILKGTTREMSPKQNTPFKGFVSQDIYAIGQKLFRKTPTIDELGNTYYWYNLCEEWEGWDYFGDAEENIENFVDETDKKEARILLDQQKEFIKWKDGIKSGFRKIDSVIKQNNIHVCEYFQVFASEWYKREGLFIEQEFAQNSLLPNEDFEIILSALFLEVKLFVSRDEKEVIWRGAISMGLNTPLPIFCCPERVAEAIDNNFGLRFYRKK